MPMESPSKSQNIQLLRITWPFLVVILVLVSLAIFSIDIMSSVRAYIGGESIWSKGQKDAVFYRTCMRKPVTRQPIAST
jgi:hypothetical protein